MEMPLASAAKRGWTFIFVPMMLAFPLEHPSVSMYCRMRGPMTEADPASDRPNPSKIVFFPSVRTFSGMSSYFAFTMNSETYLVRPGAFGNSSAGLTEAVARSLPSANPASASDVFQKSRRIMGDHLRPIPWSSRAAARRADYSPSAHSGCHLHIEIFPGGERLTHLRCRQRMRCSSPRITDSYQHKEDSLTRKCLWRGVLIVALCVVLAT